MRTYLRYACEICWPTPFHSPSLTVVLLQNVAAVISEQAPDVLSHAAVRARNMGVLLAACHDAAILADLRSHAGSTLTMQLSQVCQMAPVLDCYWFFRL